MKYIVDKLLDLQNDAGFKARIDVINILKEEEYNYVSIRYKKNSISDIINLAYDTLKIDFEKDSQIIIQYPLNEYIIKFLLKKAKTKNCKVICFIHDIQTLRNSLAKDKVKKEIKMFNKFDYIISHNSIMTKWLRENGVTSKICDLHLFDYLASENINSDKDINDGFKIAYATGRLGTSKSKFLLNIDCLSDENNTYLLYGNIIDELKGKILSMQHVEYLGAIAPDLISKNIDGHFGLIWDSGKVEECTGKFGFYTRFNNPHKLSMYIAANLPVIAWNKSAIADFIIEKNIGFCIENLYDIKKRSSDLTSEEYNQMKENVKKISAEVRNGFYTKNVIQKLEL